MFVFVFVFVFITQLTQLRKHRCGPSWDIRNTSLCLCLCLCHTVDPAESAWMWGRLQYKQIPVLRIKELITPARKISAQNILCKMVKHALVRFSFNISSKSAGMNVRKTLHVLFLLEIFWWALFLIFYLCFYNLSQKEITVTEENDPGQNNEIEIHFTLHCKAWKWLVWKMANSLISGDRWHFSYFRSKIVQICFWRFHPIFLTFYNKLVLFNLAGSDMHFLNWENLIWHSNHF